MSQIASAWMLILSSCMLACNTPINSSTPSNSKNMSEIIDPNPTPTQDTTETATFGAGCFWCVEAVYQQLEGVISVKSGYSGGEVKNPSYKEVCTGRTGHAEVCQIVFNPQVISYAQLLEVLFGVHDPTTLNRQGADEGTQYRSAIFYHSPEQERLAKLAIQAANESGVWKDPIVTEVTPFTNFYPAEDYHDNYYNLNGSQPYCSAVVRPKVEKFKKQFEKYLKEKH